MSALDKLKEAKTYCLRLNAISICGKISCTNGDIYEIRERLTKAIALLEKEPDPQKFLEEIERWKNYANELEDGIEKVNKVRRKLEAENKKLQEEIERLKEENRWIPVSERMPKSPTQYLCCYYPYCHELPQMYFATTWSKAKGFFLEDGKQVFPTHWKPITLPNTKVADQTKDGARMAKSEPT